MTSLKRSLGSNPYDSQISSKVFVRATKSGKVQKIVRELYLRQDIPCSSKLCSTCLSTAPRDAGGVGMSILQTMFLWKFPDTFSQLHHSSCPKSLLVRK